MRLVQVIVAPVYQAELISCLVHMQSDIGMMSSIFIKQGKKKRTTINHYA